MKAKFLPEWIIRNDCHAYMYMQFSLYLDIAIRDLTQCVPRKNYSTYIGDDYVYNF